MGTAVTNEMESVEKESDLRREDQKLKSPDILAIKGLAQFERFPAVVALGDLIENWHISDFHISKARPEQEAGYASHWSFSIYTTSTKKSLITFLKNSKTEFQE
jgi:predicted ATPase